MRLLILSSLLLISCATEIIPRNPLYKQRLVPRAGFEGYLTNQICTKYKLDDCQKFDTIKYNLTDSRLRKQLNDFRFTCQIAGQRWRICLDKAGFCRRTLECVKKNIFGHCNEYYELFISIADYQYLLDANTSCQSE